MKQEDDKVVKCGWSLLTCKCLQKFLRIEVFVASVCCYAFVQGMVVSGLVSVVLSTIERRFDVSSVQSGMVAMGFDLASIICLVPVSYFCGLHHKPRWIATGSLFMGLGSLLFMTPHILAGKYTFTNEVEDTLLCGVNSTSSCHHHPTDNSTVPNTSSSTKYIYIMFIANMLHGIGASPVFTIVVAFIDENTHKKNTSMYMAIYYSMALIGPAVGYIIGGQTLETFVDVGTETSLTPKDRWWVGAWWIGFLVSGTFALLIAIPLYAFPRELPGKEQIQMEKKLDKLHVMGKVEEEETAPLRPQDILKSLKVLLINPVFAFINLSCAAEGALISGFVTFSPKFVEANFNLSPSGSAQLIGMATIPSGGLGMVLGGYLVKRYSLGGLSSLKVSLVFVGASLCFSLILLIRCEDVRYAGINFPYRVNGVVLSEPTLESPCNKHCSCLPTTVDPVCGMDGITYVSPCHAGCGSFNLSDNENEKFYKDCSCIGTNLLNDSESNGTAVQGKCEDKCNLLGVFMPAYSLIIGVTFIICTPVLTATLRCVPENQKSLALGWQWLTARILGMIPAPLIFGTIIDKACLFWHSSGCSSETGSCLLYTSNKLSVYFLCIVLVYKSASLVCLLCAYSLFHRRIHLSTYSIPASH